MVNQDRKGWFEVKFEPLDQIRRNFGGIERSSLPSKNFPCISMDMLQIGALVLLGRLLEAR